MNVTLPRWISTDRHQMASDVTSLNFGVPQNSKKWQETTIHRIQPHGRRDVIYNRLYYLRFPRNYVKVRWSVSSV